MTQGNWPWLIALVVVVAIWSMIRRVARFSASVDLIKSQLPGNAASNTSANSTVMPMPAHIIELIRQGRQVEAIKAMRELTGMDLKDAHTAVKNWRSEDGSVRIESSVLTFNPKDAPPDLLEKILNGDKIGAIKEFRRDRKCSLMEAKQAVEVIESSAAAGRDFNMPQPQPFSTED